MGESARIDSLGQYRWIRCRAVPPGGNQTTDASLGRRDAPPSGKSLAQCGSRPLPLYPNLTREGHAQQILRVSNKREEAGGDTIRLTLIANMVAAGVNCNQRAISSGHAGFTSQGQPILTAAQIDAVQRLAAGVQHGRGRCRVVDCESLTSSNRVVSCPDGCDQRPPGFIASNCRTDWA